MTETDTLIRCRCIPVHGAGSLLLTETATAVAAADARRWLIEWARQRAVPSETVADIVYAVYEAIANVVEHAYPNGVGTFTLRADLAPNQLCVIVSDTGTWSPPDPTPDARGRGIPLIRALADSVHISTGNEGTIVELHWEK